MATTTTNTAYAPEDVVYLIAYCDDLKAEAVVQGTIYRIDIVITTPTTTVIKYVLKTSYSQSVTVEGESLIFADKATAFTELESRTA